jgi:hypothetical protein
LQGSTVAEQASQYTNDQGGCLLAFRAHTNYRGGLSSLSSSVEVSMQRMSCSRVGAVVLVSIACAIVSSSAAASPGADALRRAFGQVFFDAKTGNPSACSQATARGRFALTEFARGEEHYLPSTTCQEAVAAFPNVEAETTCGLSATELAPAIRTAVLHINGRHAAVQLVEDAVCAGSEIPVTGSAALQQDPLMATTHWTLRHGRWLFDDQPTGTYSPAGRKAAALLRTALTGSTITETWAQLPPFPDIDGAAFCSNGSTQITLFSHVVPGGTWYVAGGYSILTDAPGPAFDPQGNPQGAVFIHTPVVIEWALTLASGTIDATQPPTSVPPLPSGHIPPLVFQPGDAHC